MQILTEEQKFTVLEALRSSQELVAYMHNSANADPEEAGLELLADEPTAMAIIALLNDVTQRTTAAINLLEGT